MAKQPRLRYYRIGLEFGTNGESWKITLNFWRWSREWTRQAGPK
jgi:hypothetical protein